MSGPSGNGQRGTAQEVLLRYRYPDGRVQAAMPMRVVEDRGDWLVAWLSAGTEIAFWALPDGGDPRVLPLQERFTQRLTTTRRTWQGNGVLRVIPVHEPYQVIHFWDEAGNFAGWYVNLEAPKTRDAARLDTMDWQLDLQISPDRVPNWKDEDEADAAVETGWLAPGDLERAWDTGRQLLQGLDDWPAPIGDWRSYRPPASWSALPLPANWAE